MEGSSPHTLSLCIFDDLQPVHGPYEIEISGLTKEKIQEGLDALLEKFRKKPLKDRSGYFDEEFFREERHMKRIVQGLHETGYWVCNEYHKYYVIALALDYTRFEIFSKGCYPERELISWGPGKEGPIKGLITAENYHVTPKKGEEDVDE